MSRLDEILQTYDAFFVSEQAINNGRGLAKQQIKDLMLELIDTCQFKHDPVTGGSDVDVEELRKEVGEL